MYHFFADKNQFDGEKVYLTGDDYHHAVRVLRIKKGEKVLISDESGRDYLCEADSTGTAADGEEALILRLVGEYAFNHELPASVTLFQCVIKGDRMELIIEKAVELGVSRIVPVMSRFTVARIPEGRGKNKLRRWQAIAESAAKQSKRSIVPVIGPFTDFDAAVREMCLSDISFIPYECEEGMENTLRVLGEISPGKSIAVMIGPEGGFHPEEIGLAAQKGITRVSLGKRILRAETAAITVLGLVMTELEKLWQ